MHIHGKTIPLPRAFCQNRQLYYLRPHERRKYPIRISNQSGNPFKDAVVSYRSNNPFLLHTILHNVVCTNAAANIGNGKSHIVGFALRHGKRVPVPLHFYFGSRRRAPYKKPYQTEKEKKMNIYLQTITMAVLLSLSVSAQDGAGWVKGVEPPAADAWETEA